MSHHSEAIRNHPNASSVSTTSSNDPHLFQLDKYQPIIYGSDTILGVNLVEKELECQICLCVLTTPTLLPCGAHSVCFSCMASFFKHLKKEQFGKRAVYCPSCGADSGQVKVLKIEDLKANKELERVYRAYEREKSMWVEEKIKLETQLNCINKMKEDEQAKKKKEAAKKCAKGGLTEQEEEAIKDMLERLGAEKLKKMSMMSFEKFEAAEKSEVTPLKKKGKKEEKEISPKMRAMVKGASQRRRYSEDDIEVAMTKRKNTVSVNELDKKMVGLRNVKKTKI